MIFWSFWFLLNMGLPLLPPLGGQELRGPCFLSQLYKKDYATASAPVAGSTFLFPDDPDTLYPHPGSMQNQPGDPRRILHLHRMEKLLSNPQTEVGLCSLLNLYNLTLYELYIIANITCIPCFLIYC